MYLHNIDHSDTSIQVMLVVITLVTWIQSLVPFNEGYDHCPFQVVRLPLLMITGITYKQQGLHTLIYYEYHFLLLLYVL
jgi:hypothetical protein